MESQVQGCLQYGYRPSKIGYAGYGYIYIFSYGYGYGVARAS
jgi:hypothetical protein